MPFAQIFLLGALSLEILLRILVEVRELRLLGKGFDRFSILRILPILNDVFPAEANFEKRTNSGAFVDAHEKAHAELHHGIVRLVLQAGFAGFCALCLGLAGMLLELGLFWLLVLFHLIFATAKVIFHALCFAEEFEADRVAAKRVQRGVALRALNALAVNEFPRSRLFAYLYRQHPTALMRIEKLGLKAKP